MHFFSQHKTKREDFSSGIEQTSKNTSWTELSYFIIGSIAVDDHNVWADNDLLEFVKSSKNIIDADSDDENEINNAASARTSSELRNVMKSRCSYLDAHSNDEINNKMDVTSKISLIICC
ncbi:hypothetical protein TNCV_999411 [Trichonephila clavipes]|nr:hypothetical protein TNCV_999411 [Trichonephila clavipes]